LLKINEHKEEILMKFGYKEFEKSIIESKRDKDLNHEEKEESIVKALNERIADEKFIQEMVKILSNYRYKQIYQLINPPK
jgi:nickel-dependent lactate racemase